MQRLAHLQAVASYHRRERPAVEEAVSAGPSRLSERGGQRQERRPVLEGHFSEELHSQLFEERLAERTIQQRDISGGAERQEDGSAGRRDLGRDPAGRAGQMNDCSLQEFIYHTLSTSECLIFNFNIYILYFCL